MDARFKFLLRLIVIPIVGAAQVFAPSDACAVTTQRVVHFPLGRSLGVASVFYGDGSWRQVHGSVEARGDIEVPDGCFLSLETLDISEPNLAWLESLKPDDLTSVSLRGQCESDSVFRHLSHLTGLKNLELRVFGINDSTLVYLKGMTKLTSLDLRSTGIKGIGLERLSGLDSLRELRVNLVPNQWSIKILPVLPSVRVLMVEGFLSAKELGLLMTQTLLDTLDLQHAEVTEEQIAQLHAALSKTELLYFLRASGSEEVLHKYEEIWRRLMSKLNGLDDDYLDAHVTVKSRTIHKWMEGFSFEIYFSVRYQRIEVESYDAFLVKRSDHDPYLTEEEIEANIGRAYFEIGKINPVHELRFNWMEEALGAARELCRCQDMQLEELSFRVPGKLPRQDGDPYLLFGGVIDGKANRCIRGYLNLVTGVGEAHETACWISLRYLPAGTMPYHGTAFDAPPTLALR